MRPGAGASGLLGIRSADLAVTISPRRGGEIVSVVRRGHGEIMYRVPRGGALATTTTTPAERWLHRYRGGWQMLFPNVGDDSRIADVEYAFNGGVDQVEWEFTGDERRVVGSCVVHGSRISRTYGFAGARALEVLTVVENSTEAPLPYLWSEHPAFLAHDDATVESDAGWVEALLTMPAAGGEHLERLTPREPVVRVSPGHRAPVISLAWDADHLPGAWIWLQNGVARPPFAGGDACIAVEPTNALTQDGIGSAVARGMCSSLAPLATLTARVTLGVE